MNVGHILFSINGRINRKTWWLVHLIIILALGIVFTINSKIGLHPALFGGLITILFLGIRIAADIKRWHDRGKSGWWLLLQLIPIAGLVWSIAELGFLKGTDGENQFGEEAS